MPVDSTDRDGLFNLVDFGHLRERDDAGRRRNHDLVEVFDSLWGGASFYDDVQLSVSRVQLARGNAVQSGCDKLADLLFGSTRFGGGNPIDSNIDRLDLFGEVVGNIRGVIHLAHALLYFSSNILQGIVVVGLNDDLEAGCAKATGTGFNTNCLRIIEFVEPLPEQVFYLGDVRVDVNSYRDRGLISATAAKQRLHLICTYLNLVRVNVCKVRNVLFERLNRHIRRLERGPGGQRLGDSERVFTRIANKVGFDTVCEPERATKHHPGKNERDHRVAQRCAQRG